MSARTTRVAALALVAAVGLAGCTQSGDPDAADPTETVNPGPRLAELESPQEPVTVLEQDDAAGLAAAASATFFAAAPVVVLAEEDDPVAVLRAASAGIALAAPVLLAGGDEQQVAAELDRLGTEAVLGFGDVALPGQQDADASPDDDAETGDDAEVAGSGGGDITLVPAPEDDAALAELLGMTPGDPVALGLGTDIAGLIELPRGELTPVEVDEESYATDGDDATDGAVAGGEESDVAGAGESEGDSDAQLPATEPAEPITGILALSTGFSRDAAAVATAAAAGAELAVAPGGDPRATEESVTAIAEAEADAVVGLGARFEDADTLDWRFQAAATGVELPGGGQLVFPDKRYVALYGTPSTTSLGVLGEQDVPATVERAAEHAAGYDDLTDDEVIPALEIIATVASSSAGGDGDYSNEMPPDSLLPLVEAAGEAGQYVLLDLQPGRSSFVEQAQLYEELLAYPHVGLALDPEWNLGADEVHLAQIGSTTADEVNEVVDWLADFTRENALPQKMLVLHQFQVRMIQTVPEVDLSRSELAVLVHADGQGAQSAKQDTWRTLRANAPDIEWWGWKNFYDEDSPMLTPEETAQVVPFPNFVSYQ